MARSFPSLVGVRRIVWISLAVLAVCILAARVLAMTPIGHAIAESVIEGQSVRGQSVAVTDLSGDLLGRFEIKSLTISDGTGQWVSADGIAVDWSPFAAIKRRLSLSIVSADRINVSRRPVLTEPSVTGSGGSWFRRYDVADVSVGRLDLEDDVVGPAQSYSVSAGLVASENAGDVSFALSPKDHQADSANLTFSWAPESLLTGRAELLGQPGGLIATLLDVPDTAPVAAFFEARGDLDNWTLDANGQIGAAPWFQAGITRQGPDWVGRATLDLGLTGVTQIVMDRLGRNAQLNAQLSEGDTVDRLTVGLSAPNLAGDLQGDLVLSDGKIALRQALLSVTEIDAERLTGMDSFQLPIVSFAGDIKSDESGFVLIGAVTAPMVKVDRIELSDAFATGEIRYGDGAIETDLDLSTYRLSGLPDGLAAEMTGPVSARLDAQYELASSTADIRSAVIDAGAYAVTASGMVGQEQWAELSGTATLSPIEGLPSADLSWSLTGSLQEKLSLNVEGAIGTDRLPSVVHNLFGSAPNLSVSASRRSDGEIEVRRFSLSGSESTVLAAGSLAGGQIDLSGTAALSSLDVGAASFAPSDISFNAMGAMSSPEMSIALSTPRVMAQSRDMEAVAAQLNLTTSGGLSFNLNATGTYDGVPAMLAGIGQMRDGNLAIDGLKLDWADLTASGEALANISAPEQSTLNISVLGTAPGMDQIDVTAVYANQRLDTVGRIGGFTRGPFNLQESEFSFGGVWPVFAGTAKLNGRVEESLNAAWTADPGLRVDLAERTAEIDVSGQIAGTDFATTETVRVAWANGLSAHGALNLFGGDLRLDLANPREFSLETNNLSIGEIGRLAERPGLRGSVRANVRLAVGEDGLNGSASANLIGLASGAPAAPSADVNLDANWQDGLMRAAITASDGDDTLNLVSRIGARFTTKDTLLSARIADDAPTPISISGGGDLAPLISFFAPPNVRLAGDVELNLSNGDGVETGLTGDISLSDGEVEDGATGLYLTNVSLGAALQPDGLRIENGRANGASGGVATASGQYRFDGDGAVDVRLDRLDPFRRDDVRGTISGLLSVQRANRQTQVVGNLEIIEAEIDLSDLPGSGYTTIEVDFGDPDENGANQDMVREAIELDIAVTADRRIFVRNPQIDTEWALDARVRGSPGAPILSGAARLVRGEVDLLSRRFSLSEGTIRFLGAPLDTEVSLLASRMSGRIMTRIGVAGTIDDLSIVLESEPALPEDEIISRVLFGRSPSELSGLEAAQLAAAAAQLSGGSSLDLFGDLRTATGLDRLDIEFGDDGARLATGKYLADDVYLEIETGVSGAPGVALEWTPRENVAIGADIDPEAGPRVSIQWRRDFDRLFGELDETQPDTLTPE